MSSKCIFGALAACVFLAMPATAQSQQPAPTAPAATAPAPAMASGQWRASKLIGVDVYNEQNEKLGDINEVLLDHSGKVAGVVIGVGGFLGMGQHDVLVTFDKLKWVNEPVRMATVPPTGTTGTAPPAATTGTATPARPARVATEKWYPDHAVLSATKDQLKAMAQFKYN